MLQPFLDGSWHWLLAIGLIETMEYPRHPLVDLVEKPLTMSLLREMAVSEQSHFVLACRPLIAVQDLL